MGDWIKDHAKGVGVFLVVVALTILTFGLYLIFRKK